MKRSSAIQAELSAIHPVSRETVDRLWRYHDLLAEWQGRTNLVSADSLQHFWTRHVADSLQCLNIASATGRWVDLGSGGGFPGLVIAIAADAACEVHLVESNRKKCAFLRTVSMNCGISPAIHVERIENFAARAAGKGPRFDVVTARALAPLPRLLELAAPLLGRGATGIFHKGRDFRRELADCRGLWRFDLVIHESRIAADSVLLEIRNLSA